MNGILKYVILLFIKFSLEFGKNSKNSLFITLVWLNDFMVISTTSINDLMKN
jgi:hypothetical protein